MSVSVQQWISFLLVTACSLYAVWMLLPAAARRLLARWLQQLPLGTRIQSAFERAASAPQSCDCSGCDKVVDLRIKPKTKVIRIHAEHK
jgi:hypothetical protein